ncbi:MAG: hypothetical protein AAFR04_06025 [Pseudomonadota bacterium]
MRTRTVTQLAAGAFAVGLMTATASVALATGPTVSHGPASSTGSGIFVTAHSWYGRGSLRGEVREGRRRQLQVRLPGGTWIDCERACSDTLRRNSLDFWENVREDEKDGIGYFSWFFSR